MRGRLGQGLVQAMRRLLEDRADAAGLRKLEYRELSSDCERPIRSNDGRRDLQRLTNEGFIQATALAVRHGRGEAGFAFLERPCRDDRPEAHARFSRAAAKRSVSAASVALSLRSRIIVSVIWIAGPCQPSARASSALSMTSPSRSSP